MTPINDFIVINTIDHSKFNEDYKIVQTISTDEYAQSPYQEWKIYTDNKLFKTCKPGFHFQRIEKKKAGNYCKNIPVLIINLNLPLSWDRTNQAHGWYTAIK